VQKLEKTHRVLNKPSVKHRRCTSQSPPKGDQNPVLSKKGESLDSVQSARSQRELRKSDSEYVRTRTRRVEPFSVPLKVLDHKKKLYNSKRYVVPTYTGIKFLYPLTKSDVTFLNEVYRLYSSTLRLCQMARNNREYKTAQRMYHDVRRYLLSKEGTYGNSHNIRYCLAVIGITLRIAKRELCSQGSGSTRSFELGS